MKKKIWISGAILAVVLGGAVAVTAESVGHGGRMGGDAMGGMGPDAMPAFETLDADSDGNVTIAEIHAAEAARFAAADANGDGLLSAEELTAEMAKRTAERAATRIAQMIAWQDVDGDGALSLTEMGSGMGQRMFQRLDSNDDGMISSEEFAAAKTRMADRGNGMQDGHGDRKHGRNGG